jgi:hypothetical protein
MTPYAIIPLTHKVHVGIDVHMSRQDAEAILAGGGGLSATLMADDYWFDTPIKSLQLSWQVVGDCSLSAEFDDEVSRRSSTRTRAGSTSRTSISAATILAGALPALSPLTW